MGQRTREMYQRAYFEHVCNEAIYSPGGMAKLENILGHSKVYTTFFGCKYIKLDGCPGSIGLDRLASRIGEIAYTKSKHESFTAQDRVNGIDCVYKLREFTKISREQIAQSNILTRIFHFIGNMFGPIVSEIEEFGSHMDYFKGYSEAEFKRTFPGEPLPVSFFDKDFKRFYLTEEQIRSLALQS